MKYTQQGEVGVRRWLAGLGVGLVFLLSPFVSGANEYPPDPEPTPFPFRDTGTTESSLAAQVVFDEEGEAAVAVEIDLRAGRERVESLKLDIPGTVVRVLRTLQQYLGTKEEEVCKVYAPLPSFPLGARLEKPPCLRTEKVKVPSGLEIADLDVTAERTASGVVVTMPLKQPVEPRGRTTLVIAYKAMGYAKGRGLGAHAFDFPTPQMPLDLQRVRVAVDVQPGLVLEGGRTSTAYQPSIAEGLASAPLPGPGLSQRGFAFSSPVSRYIANRSDAFVRSQSALDPNESFHVKGRYATNWLRLNYRGGVVGVALLLAFLGVLLWGERKIRRTMLRRG